MNDESPSNPISLAPTVSVEPAQVRPGLDAPHDHRSRDNLDHLWSDDSPLMSTLQEINHLKHSVRNWWGDPAAEPLLFKAKMWYRILVSLKRDSGLPQYQYVQICALLDETRDALGIK